MDRRLDGIAGTASGRAGREGSRGAPGASGGPGGSGDNRVPRMSERRAAPRGAARLRQWGALGRRAKPARGTV